MKRNVLILLFLLLVTSACTMDRNGSSGEGAEPSPPGGQALSTQSADSAAQNEMALPFVIKPSGVQELDSTELSGCEGEQNNPLAENIADTYEVPYEEVLMYYCAGIDFEELLLALETMAQTGTAVEDILQMRQEGESWDGIWQRLGLIE